MVFAVVDAVTLCVGMKASELAKLGAKGVLKFTGKTMLVDMAAFTASYGVSNVGDELELPLPLTLILSGAAGITLSIKLGKYVFKDSTGQVILESNVDEVLDTIEGIGTSGADVEIKYPLDKSNQKHINKHIIESVVNQSEYLSDSQLADKLDDSFFIPKWSTAEINGEMIRGIMFKIKYKLFNNDDLDKNELRGEDGYLELEMGKEKYGIFIDKELDEFSVSVYWWFYYLLGATVELQKEYYILLSDIEKPQIWIEIKKSDNILQISKVSADKTIGSGALETRIMPNLKYKYWKNQEVTFKQFKDEVFKMSTLYIENLKKLNEEGHEKISKLESLVKQLDSAC